jgi:serine/threonine protein kinase
MLQKISHKNIIRLYEQVEDEKYKDYYIILMELAQGGSLFNFIK